MTAITFAGNASYHATSMIWLALASLLVTVAIGVAFVLWIRWLWKRTNAPHWALILSSFVLVVPLALGLLGTLGGMLDAFGAVGGESVDPSQKARILGAGISEAMNCTAFGVLVVLVALPLTLLLLTWRYHWSKAKKTP